MPRLSPSLLRHAYSLSPHLPQLLPVCRDLPSALNELRWLREHAATTPSPHQSLHNLIAARATGQPLQYVLGTQPFGALEILCRKGVLIPRPETESQTTHLAQLLLPPPTQHLLQQQQPLRILDLCTGSGCIPLHLHSLLSPHYGRGLSMTGIDVAPPSIRLARANLSHNIRLGTLRPEAATEVSFQLDDLFAPTTEGPEAWWKREWDVVVANPPYISPRGFDTETAMGVRRWEPLGALVPPLARSRSGGRVDDEGGENGGDEGGDTFYPCLFEIAERVRAKALWCEVGGMAQAGRVVGMVKGRSGWGGCEIWRDWPDADERDGEVVRGVKVRGEGNGRGVFAWRGERRKLVGRG